MRQRAAAGCHLWHAHRGEPARSTGCERGRGRGSERGSERGRTREAFAVPLYGNAQPRPFYGRNRVGPKIASSSSSLSRGIDTAARWRPQLGWAIARDASALRRVVKNSRTPEPEAPGAQKPSAPSSTCLSLSTQRRCVFALYRGVARARISFHREAFAAIRSQDCELRRRRRAALPLVQLPVAAHE